MENLIKALSKAYTACGYVQKKGQMNAAGANYKFAKESDFIEAIRPAMIENGLTLNPSGISSLHHDQYQNKSGTPTNRVVGVFTFRLSHTSGESIQVSALGEGIDTGDKASYKAMTGALKYALRQTMLIETGDDPDNEIPEPRIVPREAPVELTIAEKTLKAIEAAKSLVNLFGLFKGGDSRAFVSENQKMYDACMKYPEAQTILEEGGL